MAKTCKGCIYWRRIGDGSSYVCHFLLDTDEPRGCPAEGCTRRQVPPAVTPRAKLKSSCSCDTAIVPEQQEADKPEPEKENVKMEENIIDIPKVVDDAVMNEIEAKNEEIEAEEECVRIDHRAVEDLTNWLDTHLPDAEDVTPTSVKKAMYQKREDIEKQIDNSIEYINILKADITALEKFHEDYMRSGTATV